MTNQFEALCILASDENWCWKLCCTTCGHMHFRYAFSELAMGKSVTDSSWAVRRRRTRYTKSIGFIPRNYSEEQKAIIIGICCNASLSSISDSCKFPDWLGYLGLVLSNTHSAMEAYKELSSNWASQLSSLVSESSPIQLVLRDIAEGSRLLNLNDLEACEKDLMHNNSFNRTDLAPLLWTVTD